MSMHEAKPTTAVLAKIGAGRDSTAVYRLQLRVQDLAVIDLNVAGELCGEAVVFAPDGSRVKGCELDGDGRFAVAFVADRTGAYRLEIRAAAGRVDSCAVMLRQVLSLADRSGSFAADRPESARIRRLRLDMCSRPAAALAEFWREVQTSGTPLCEADPDHPDLTLCTFLWRGNRHVRHVRVNLLFRTALPNDYQMVRLAGTDVWYTTVRLSSRGRLAYTLLVNAPPLPPPNFDSSAEHKLLYLAVAQADPLNPRRCFGEQGSPYETQSLLELPAAPPQPWIEERPGTPCGTLRRSRFASRRLQDSRLVDVYTPPGYSESAAAYSLLLLFDGQWYLARARAATILDNLLAAGKIPPLVTVFIGNGPQNARSRQLPCNPDFVAFLAEELLPWVRERCHVTDDPARRIIAGASYGGLAAAYAALAHPDLFGNVLAQSGSFWWHPPQAGGQRGNYIASLLLRQPLLPLRFYLDAGSDELDFCGSGRSILAASRHLRDVLLAKGYPVAYQEFSGGHGFLSWRGTLADGLIQLTAGWG